MFEKSSIFVLSTDNTVYRLEIDETTRKVVCDSFEKAVNTMVYDKACVEFDGSYKPEDDEILKIDNFQIYDSVKDAIRHPLGVTQYSNENESERKDNEFFGFPEIKAIFAGERLEDDDTEHFTIAFQRYRREQNIVTIPHRLYWSDNTFRQDKHFGIGITNSIDCIFDDGELLFTSYFFARQVFDLSSYYRSATDKEVVSFTENDNLYFEDAEAFKALANSYVRRKIAMINDSKVLDNYSATQIHDFALNSGIDISIENDKVAIPSDKENALLVVGFLDEEAYRGPFSNNLLLANSKKVIRKGKP